MSDWIRGIPGEETIGWVKLDDDTTVRLQKHGDRYSVESVVGASESDLARLAIALIQATPGDGYESTALLKVGEVFASRVEAHQVYVPGTDGELRREVSIAGSVTRERAIGIALALIRAAKEHR